MKPDHDLCRRFGYAMADRQLPQTSQAIVLAVSGGADSLGMVALIRSWCDHIAADSAYHLVPHLSAVIVDHGLRHDSSAEAQQVASMLRAKGVEAKVLQITANPPEYGLAEWARKKRYELLAVEAMKQDAVLLTAHHADDQLETVEMRLSRGSGLRGLAAMRPEVGHLGVRLIRPCLGFTKSELAKAAIDAGFAPVSDPTNIDQRFQRPRLRADRDMRGQSGVTDQQLMSLCQLSARLIDRTDDLVKASAPTMFRIYPQGCAVMAKHVLKEKGFFLIAGHILRHMAAKPYPANEDAIAHLKQRLLSDQAATLSGCEWRQDSQNRDQIIILREPDAPIESIMLSEGKGIFDNRWKINYPHQVRVEAIDDRRFAQIRRYLPQVDDWPGCMARAFWSLPVLIDENTKNLAELDRLVLDDGAIFPHLMKVSINSHVKLMSDFSMARFLGA